MKLEGYFRGIPFYSDPDCPKGKLVCIGKYMAITWPKRKDGKPDMRFKFNTLLKLIKVIS